MPRIRGYYLCTDMTPWTKEEIERTKKDIEIDVCKKLCRSIPRFSPNLNCMELSKRTDRIVNKYMILESLSPDLPSYKIETGIKWDKIHGKKRKILKTAIHNKLKEFNKYVTMWNSYCGREDVMCICSRIGGNNWNYYRVDANGKSLDSNDWFLEKVDDWYDNTYCYIYAKIGV